MGAFMSRWRPTFVIAFAVLQCCWVSQSFATLHVLDGSRVCGTDETGAMMVAPDPLVIDKWIRDNRIAAGGVISVNFHVIYNPSTGEGNVPESWLNAQIAVLNSTFAGNGYNNGSHTGDNTGYTFVKNSVTRTGNRQWFTMTPEPPRKRRRRAPWSSIRRAR
jgi:hypothetical protein